METRPIKVCLVGDAEQKNIFINAIGVEDENRIIGIDFFHVPGQSPDVTYQVWDLAGQERFRSTLPIYLKGANAIIYLNPTIQIKELVEGNRDKNTCIAIDFNSLNVTAKECLNSIEFLLNIKETDKQKLAIKCSEKNAALVSLGQKTHGTVFHFFPKDIVNIINHYQYLLAKQFSFFGGSSAKPIFIGLPPKSLLQAPVQQRKVEEEKNDNPNNRNNCSIQ